MVPALDYFRSPELYDIVYSGIRDDIPFWVAQAKAASPGPGGSGRVLELACGTGRVLIPCLEAGVEIEGLDLSEAMIGSLRSKLAARGLAAELTVGDMRDFELPRRFALILIAFNSFLHNLTAADQLATLERCREHLAPGGRLMLVTFHPDSRKLLANDGVPRVVMTSPLPSGEGQARVTEAGRIDPVEQRITIARKVERLDPAGAVTATHDLALELRYVWKPEMELLLARAGFQRFAVEARTGYTAGFAPRPAIEEGDTLVWTAWRD